MGFLGGEYEEQENDNKDIEDVEDNPEIEVDTEVHNASNIPNNQGDVEAKENKKKKICESLKKINEFNDNLQSIANDIETTNVINDDIESRISHEFANLSSVMDMVKGSLLKSHKK